MKSTTLTRVVRAGGNTIHNYSLFIVFIILGTGARRIPSRIHGNIKPTLAVYFHMVGHQPFYSLNEMREENFLLEVNVMYEVDNWSECSLLQISSYLVCS